MHLTVTNSVSWLAISSPLLTNHTPPLLTVYTSWVLTTQHHLNIVVDARVLTTLVSPFYFFHHGKVRTEDMQDQPGCEYTLWTRIKSSKIPCRDDECSANFRGESFSVANQPWESSLSSKDEALNCLYLAHRSSFQWLLERISCILFINSMGLNFIIILPLLVAIRHEGALMKQENEL